MNYFLDFVFIAFKDGRTSSKWGPYTYWVVFLNEVDLRESIKNGKFVTFRHIKATIHKKPCHQFFGKIWELRAFFVMEYEIRCNEHAKILIRKFKLAWDFYFFAIRGCLLNQLFSVNEVYFGQLYELGTSL